MHKSTNIYRDLYEALRVVDATWARRRMSEENADALLEGASLAISNALTYISELELIAHDVMDAEGKRQSAITRAKAVL